MKKDFLVIFVIFLGMMATSVHARKARVAVEAAEEYVNKSLPDEATVWDCWYDGNQAIQCRLAEPVEAAQDEGVGEWELAPADTDVRLPGFVGKVWRQATELARRWISIPLHTVPYDMAMTGELAESVMCSRAAHPCGIIFAKNAVLLSQLIAMRRSQVAARMSSFSLAANH